MKNSHVLRALLAVLLVPLPKVHMMRSPTMEVLETSCRGGIWQSALKKKQQ